MTIKIKLINAVLTHDTSTFYKMVFLHLLRTPTASSPSEINSTAPALKIMPEKMLHGMKNSHFEMISVHSAFSRLR